MNLRRITGIVGGAAAGVAALGAEIAEAQDNSGGSINLGGSIASSVQDAVSGIATNSSASGGTQVEHSEMHLGDQEGVAIADSSGGNNNVSFVS